MLTLLFLCWYCGRIIVVNFIVNVMEEEALVVVDMELLVAVLVLMIQLLHLFLKLNLNSIQFLNSNSFHLSRQREQQLFVQVDMKSMFLKPKKLTNMISNGLVKPRKERNLI